MNNKVLRESIYRLPQTPVRGVIQRRWQFDETLQKTVADRPQSPGRRLCQNQSTESEPDLPAEYLLLVQLTRSVLPGPVQTRLPEQAQHFGTIYTLKLVFQSTSAAFNGSQIPSLFGTIGLANITLLQITGPMFVTWRE